MTLNIDFAEARQAEIMQLLDSLVRLGAIYRYSKPKKWNTEDGFESDEEMVDFLKASEKQADEGMTLSSVEVKTLR